MLVSPILRGHILQFEKREKEMSAKRGGNIILPVGFILIDTPTLYNLSAKRGGNIALAVGAHPDDIELGCGGTLRKHVEAGDKVYGLVLTKGEKGEHHPGCKECKASIETLGLEHITLLGFKDGYLGHNNEVVKAIEEYIKRYGVNIMYAHSEHDWHQDHRAASLASSSAARNIPNILLYQSPSFTPEFTPHGFSDITSTIDTKLEALSKYISQLQKKTILNLDDVRAQAEAWGCRVKNGTNSHRRTYAEAFELNHMVLNYWR